jgi:hypothetical protein
MIAFPAEGRMPRFVLLEHTVHGMDGGSATLHWDLMVEIPGQARLRTWRLLAAPVGVSGPIPAEAIGDHRQAYLEYEGDVGGGRGVVRRVDRGEARLVREDRLALELELEGKLLNGRYCIAAGSDGQLTFACGARRAAPGGGVPDSGERA